jgi:predicted transcriptional regulator YheO
LKRIQDEIKLFNSLVAAIGAHFGKYCEVVLHDYEQPYDSTIISIANGHVTNRKIGDCGTNLGLEVLRGTDRHGDKYNYLTQTRDGRLLRSTTVYIRNNKGKAIGALCMNLDITDITMADKALQCLINTDDAEPVKEVITNDVNELLDILIQESIQSVGVPVAMMDREQKIKGIRYLDAKGAFLIKKAGDRIARFYDISKYTMYSYLEENRSANGLRNE